MFSLEGRVALVTGSSKGLGKAIAMGLGKAGAKVAINYQNNTAKAEATAEELRGAGCQVALVRADITSAADVQRLCETVAKELGPIDILVPNATPDQPQRPIEQYEWDFYQSMIDFFLKSPYLLTRATLPHMKKQKYGRIINITSEVYHQSVGNFSAYVAAKGAQIGWSRSMATELAPHGITVNTIAPGWIPVERHEKDPQEVKDAYLASIPARRWGTPEDVANAVVYYASSEASFVTGQTLCVNGGATPW